METKSKTTSTSFKETITVTFGDCAENHVGMQKLGATADHGFDKATLVKAKTAFEIQGCTCELIALHDYLPDKALAQADNKGLEAWLLVARKGVAAFVDSDALMTEMRGLSWDKKAKSRGRVINKRARHNLCFADAAQEPNYDEGRGRVVAFNTLAGLSAVRAGLGQLLGSAGSNLVAEGNYYYDRNKCYIGWHGDAERRKVVALRLGAPMSLAYHWHQQSRPVGRLFQVTLNHGDLYVMSEKAVGTDWLKRKTFTLRHAAGDKGVASLKKPAAAGDSSKSKGTKRTKSEQQGLLWSDGDDDRDERKDAKRAKKA